MERPVAAPPTTLRAEIAEGVRWLWGNRLLRILALALGLMNLTLTATESILVLFAQERLGLGPVGYGTLLSSIAVGGSPPAWSPTGWSPGSAPPPPCGSGC